MKKLYKFFWDCGRMGDLDGLFVAEEEDVAEAIGNEIYFGEVLGKHSEIFGELEEEDVTVVTDDQTLVGILLETMRGESISGYNPIKYYMDRKEYDDEVSNG